ncbi:dihydroneopterin aldolase [Chitinophaga skermanii]|uniref:Dihydroneopterin aldolase n=1 Tax=Chitinophaga skermanii TaxID=331697 RepID=A0A327QCG7_9BACT|nr:dihydroneopterin aldolase [Chitinophaga skermanii]RAJ02249.1 dihydroneopterin aldolase [Chitinophaga skermanii]
MLTIALESMEYFAYHGLYPQEKVLGNYFILDIYVKIAEPQHMNELDETVNYVHLHEIANEAMSVPTELLEQVVANISTVIKQNHPEVLYSKVALRKMHPPMGAPIRNSLVVLEKNY